jgi:hypothetical protein
MKLYKFRTVLLSIIRSLFTVHSAMVLVIQVCRQPFEQDQDGCPKAVRPQTCMTYTIAECKVNKLLMMDRGTVRNVYSFMTKRNCKISAPNRFYCKEICYDARSHERKKKKQAGWINLHCTIEVQIINDLTWKPGKHFTVWDDKVKGLAEGKRWNYQTQATIRYKAESKAIPNIKATENVTMKNDQHKDEFAKTWNPSETRITQIETQASRTIK